MTPFPLVALAGFLAAAPQPPAEVSATAWSVAKDVVAFGVALTALYAGAIRPLVRKITRTIREAIADIAVQQQATAQQVEEVRRQVHPNGGKSAHDYARRAAEGVAELQQQVFHLDQSQAETRRRVDRLATELVAQGHQVSLLAEQVAPIMHRLDSLAAQQDAAQAWQRLTDRRLDDVDTRLSEVRAAQ